MIEQKASLTKLDISGEIINLDFRERMHHLTNLKSLALNRTGVMDNDNWLSLVSQLTNLTQLETAENGLSQHALLNLTLLTNLRILDIRNNGALDNQSVVDLRPLTNLQQLYTEGTLITRDSLAQLASLKN
jgi:Leucine-rich repeat (LRR) protein